VGVERGSFKITKLNRPKTQKIEVSLYDNNMTHDSIFFTSRQNKHVWKTVYVIQSILYTSPISSEGM